MSHAGLDLSRKKLDVCLLSDQGEHLDQLAYRPMSTRFEGSFVASRKSIASRCVR